MHALVDKALSELRGAWRFRRYALFTAWAVCLLGWLVVLSLPEKYESHARVNVDTRTALRTVVEGLVVNQDVESQLNLVRQTLLGRANLETVAKKVGLDTTARTPQERDAMLSNLSTRITIALEPPTVRDPRIPNTLYRIAFTDPDRQTALKVVDVLLNSFVEDTMGSDRGGTASAQRFLREQLSEYGRRLAEAEQQLADFKKQNVGLVPGDQGGYFERLTTEMQEVKRLESALGVANSRRTELQRQMRGETPFVPPGGATTVARSTGPASQQDTAGRIQEAQSRLDDMLLRFTDKHPDVIATRETLQQLRDRQQEELAALRRGDVGAATLTGAASNPVYQSIQLQLNQTDVEIAALRSQLTDHRRNEGELRRLVDTAPEVEAQYARLTRGYDVTRTTYNTLLERLERARLSGDAEETGVVKFNIVDPPAVSFQPTFPNRPLLMTVVLVLGLGLGSGIAYLLHLLKPVFVGTKSLAEITGLPVLGAVARTWLERQHVEIRRGLMRYSAMSALLLVLFGVVVLLQQPASRFLRNVLG